MLEDLEEFFRKYYEDELLEAVREDEDFILIDYEKLDKFDFELAEELINNPEDFLETAKEAVSQIDLGTDKEIDLNVRVENIPDEEKYRIKDLRSKHLGDLVKIEGTVNRASEVKPELEVAIFECPDCGNQIKVPQLRKKMSYPSSCECGRKRGFNQVGRELSDARWIHVEDLFEEVSGEKPGEIPVYLKEGLTTPKMQRRTDPGTQLEITGEIKEMPKRVQGKRTRQLDIFMEANWINPQEISYEDLEVTEEEEERIKELAKDDNIYKKLVQSLAPSMYGLMEEKESIVLQLFGGVPQRLPDGTRIRGDIHILFVGDPSSGKTQILKLASDLLPRGRYASGKGTSAAGLTASVVRDEEFMGGWVLEAGALVLANKGVLCIDEFDKMSKEDQVNLHEAMSTQSYHPDFELLLSNGSSRKIGNIVDKLLEKHEKEIVEGENCEMLELSEGEDLELISTDFSSVYSRRPTRVSRHEAPDEFYQLETDSGRDVKVTPEHPIWTIEDGEIITKRADEIGENDWIPVPLTLPIEGEEQELDEISHFHPNSKEIEVPTHNSPELCSLVGYLVSDCGYELNRGNKNGINFTNSNPELLQDFRSLMKKLFGLEPYERERTDRGSSRTTLRYVSSRLTDFIESLGGKLLTKHDRKRIPEKIMRCRRKDLKHLTRCAFAGDGGIVEKERGLEIVYTTSSEKLAQQISDVLLRFSIPSSTRTSEAESGKEIYRVAITGESDIQKFARKIGFLSDGLNERLGEYLSEDKSLRKNMFGAMPQLGNLVTSVLEDLSLPKERVVGWSLEEYETNSLNFTHATLERILPELEERYLELFNIVQDLPEDGEGLREVRREFSVEVKDIVEELGISPSALYYRENNSTRLEEYRKVLREKLEEKLGVKSKIEFLKHLVEGEIGWVQVDSVETVSESVDWVYDVTVPGRTFISNGMVLHNTVSISKATIQATLPAETSIIGGANPKFSRFDPYRPIAEQIDIPDTLLSVDCSEPLLVKENGVVRRRKIGEFVDGYYEEEDKNGPIRPEGDVKVASMDPKDFKIEWKPIRSVFRHSVEDPLLKLSLETGREVKVTKGHSVYLWKDGEIKPVPTNEIEKGDWVVIPKKLPPGSKDFSSISLVDELLKLPKEERGMIFLHQVPEKAMERLGIKDQNWKNDRKLPLEYAEKLKKDELNQCGLKYKGGVKTQVPVKIPINEEFVRLLGYWIAEGSLLKTGSSEHLISLSFNRKEKDLISDVKKISKKLFNHEPSVVKDKNAVKVKIANKLVYLLFEKVLELEKGAKSKRAPDLIFNLSQDLQKEFLTAYHKGDYCVTASKDLMSDLHYLLLQNGVIASSQKEKPREVVFPDGHKALSSEFYSLNDADFRIESFQGVKWYETIPLNPVKDAMIALSQADSKAHFYGRSKKAKSITGEKFWADKFLDPDTRKRIKRLNLLREPLSVDEFAKKIYGIGRNSENYRSRREFARQYLNRLLSRNLVKRKKINNLYHYKLLERGEKVLREIETVEKLLGGSLGFAKVKKIEEVEPTNSYVYDLSVPGCENFVAGFGGILCHNSRFDLKFALRDVPDKERDENIVDHIIKSRVEEQEVEPVIETDFLKKYISYARRNCRPEMTKEAAAVLKNFYINLRNKFVGGESETVPITLRQYEALQRLSQASAKVRLADEVKKEDARRAIKLMKHSIKQLGMEPGAEEIDIDRVEGGTPASERSKMRVVMDLLDSLEDEIGKNIPEEDLIASLEEEGIGKPEKLIQELKNKGMIFEPRPGHVQKV